MGRRGGATVPARYSGAWISRGWFRRVCFALIAALTVPVFVPSSASAQTAKLDPYWFYGAGPDILPKWRIGGSVSTYWDYYDAFGDRTQSPYANLRLHTYTDFNLNLFRRYSPYEFVRIDLSGVVNNSDYRNGGAEGLIAERATLFWQKGDGALPFRLRVGDYYSFLSLRTLQQSLKGVHLELQPTFTLFGDSDRHSFILFSGLTNPTYRSFGSNKEVFSGASWLASRTGFGRFALNVVHGFKERDSVTGTPGLHQTLVSLGGDRTFAIGSHRIAVEGEFAGSVSDLVGSDGRVRKGQLGAGLYFLTTGEDRDLPLDWSVLFEQYGRNYAPRGAAISPNRRTLEFRTGWRFKSGLRLSGRFQRFQDDWETGNRIDTWLAGINLAGPFSIDGWPIKNLTGSFDAFVQEQASEDRTTGDRTIKLALNLTAPIDPNTTGRLGVFFSDVDTWSAGGGRQITKEVSFGLDRAYRAGSFSGTISPGAVFRTINGAGGDADQIGPTLTFSMAGRGHNLSASYGFLLVDGHTAGSSNTFAHTLGVAYSYSKGPHTFGVNFDYNDLSANPGTRANGYKAGVFYTYRFRRAPVAATARPAQRRGPAGRELDLKLLRPGMRLREAQSILEVAGIRGGLRRGNLIIYETRVIPRLGQRQRLVLAGRNGRLVRTVVIIDFTDPGSVRAVQRTYARALENLVRRYGSPQTSRLGEFDATYRENLNAGRFVRLADWNLGGGARLRLGIPQRLDRVVRLEIQVAPGFPGPRSARWGFNQVR